MSPPTKTKVWILANKPTDDAVLSGSNATFKLETQDLPSLDDGQLLLQTVYLSNDPAQRGWIDVKADPDRLYVPPVPTGDAMRARGMGKVVSSKSKDYKEGDLVTATMNWREYAIFDAKEVQRVKTDIPGVKETQFLGALGSTGLTAWVGINEIAKAKKGESIVVSGAAGATGSMVVQIAKKLIGCGKVIGIAGSDEKCQWVESLGADLCINYKKDDWKEKLVKATEGFVDVYFDNVGGEQLDLMLTRLGRGGRVAACGAIADYNKGDKSGLKNWFEIIQQRIQITGFIAFDHFGDGNAQKWVEELTNAVKDGKIKLSDENETIVDTKFEDIPKTWVKLFSGHNRGKLLTKIV
ncbi:NAD(P)-binding protein [Microthyrium microscopicum]|uniref:NAD(P)-binding protein n=1 Tax=Microthyrium microscopicum TaxID=703497 RepID=A0A6A6UFU8_9PEZI|nr:NAD(P)-binding protein [Microthyrium microscopicum]